jgi:hypothetical protein
MLVFARRIKLPLNVSVKWPHDADVRHCGGPVDLDDQEQGFYRCLPLLDILICLGSFWI